MFSKPSRTASSPLRTTSSLPLLDYYFGETAHTAARTSPLDPQLFNGLARLPTSRSSTGSPKTPVRLLSKSATPSPTHLPSPLPSPPTLMRPLISERPMEESALLGLSGMSPASGKQRPASVLWAKPGAAVFSPEARPREHIGERLLKPRELAPEDETPVSGEYLRVIFVTTIPHHCSLRLPHTL